MLREDVIESPDLGRGARGDPALLPKPLLQLAGLSTQGPDGLLLHGERQLQLGLLGRQGLAICHQPRVVPVSEQNDAGQTPGTQ